MPRNEVRPIDPTPQGLSGPSGPSSVLSPKDLSDSAQDFQSRATPAPHPESRTHSRLDRRRLLGAAAGLGAVAAGAALSGCGGDAGAKATPSATPPAPTDPPVAQVPTAAASPQVARRAAGRVAAQAGVPEGMALVASPRLPLFGVGPADPGRLLAGEVADWRQVGSPIGMAVRPLALEGVAAGSEPAETYPDYDALAAALDEAVGGVAVVPLEAVDHRVNVLSVGGVDPLRDAGEFDGEPVLRVGVVGDIVPGRNVHFKMVEYGDFTHPFKKVAATLAGFDLTFANLEGNLSRALGQPAEGDAHTYDFVSDPAMIEGFKLAGIDAVSLANNHMHWNETGWGAQGLLDTLDALDEAGFPRYGAGRTLDEARRPWTTEVKDLSVALLGVDGVTANLDQPGPDRDLGTVGPDWGAGPDVPGTNPFSLANLVADVEAAVADHDVVIPYLHMGAEYTWTVPGWVVEAAHAAIDAGAAMVVTNHPHIIQGMETYAGKPIVYSVGNFVFDQMFSVDTRQGFVLEATLRGPRVVGIRLRGVEIEDFCQPRLMSEAEHAAIMDRFWRSTDRLAGR